MTEGRSVSRKGSTCDVGNELEVVRQVPAKMWGKWNGERNIHEADDLTISSGQMAKMMSLIIVWWPGNNLPGKGLLQILDTVYFALILNNPAFLKKLVAVLPGNGRECARHGIPTTTKANSSLCRGQVVGGSLANTTCGFYWERIPNHHRAVEEAGKNFEEVDGADGLPEKPVLQTQERRMVPEIHIGNVFYVGQLMHQEQIRQLREEVQKLQKQLEAPEKKLKLQEKVKTRNRRLEEQVKKEKKAQAKELKSTENNSMKLELKKARVEIERSSQQINSLQSTLQEKERANESLQRKLSEVQDYADSLQVELLETKAKASQQECNFLRTLQEEEKANEHLQQMLSQAQEHAGSLRVALDEARTKASQHEEETEQLTRELSTTMQELSSTKQELQAAKRARDQLRKWSTCLGCGAVVVLILAILIPTTLASLQIIPQLTGGLLKTGSDLYIQDMLSSHVPIFQVSPYHQILDMAPELHYVDLITWRNGKDTSEFRLINFISSKCDKISTQLQVPKQVYDGWVKKNNFGDACHDLIQHWLESGCGPYPVAWSGLIQVLKDVELGEVAKHLRYALLNMV